MEFAYITNMYGAFSRNHFIVGLLGKVSVHAMKAYKGIWGMTPVLHVGRSWTVNITPWPLYPPGNNIRTLLRRRLGGPHRRSVTFRREKKLFFLPLPGYGPQAVLTVAVRLLFSGYRGSRRGVKMTIHFHIVPRLSMSGAFPPIWLHGF